MKPFEVTGTFSRSHSNLIQKVESGKDFYPRKCTKLGKNLFLNDPSPQKQALMFLGILNILLQSSLFNYQTFMLYDRKCGNSELPKSRLVHSGYINTSNSKSGNI